MVRAKTQRTAKIAKKTREKRELRNRYEQRYIPGQKLYLNECRPKEKADAVFDNTDIDHPSVAYREEAVQLDA